jgi:2,3-bisphosphoglycerate-independent phosphoglycerate mutase
MKYAILLGDGMADQPLAALGQKTPLEYARTPNMDRISAEGTLGLVDTIPSGFTPGSDVANLAILGYDPHICYTGRGPLEAANMGITLAPDEIAFRCNLVTLGDNRNPIMEDFTAGHITTKEATRFITDLDRGIGSERFRFHSGVGYRHLLVWKGREADLTTTPPHDIIGQAFEPHFPSGPGVEELIHLIQQSREFLENHPINRERCSAGKRPATSIWPWGQGRAPRIQRITERFNLRGGMISAVDLLNGIGVYAGLDVISVPGATGYIDTNYVGKALTALTALAKLDLIFIHVEAPDEMGHEGNLEGKIKAIEDFDEKVVGTILREIPTFGDYRIAVLSDHPTPIFLRTHTADPSPIAVFSSRSCENQARKLLFTECNAERSGFLITPGHLFLENFIGDWQSFLEQNTC